MNTDNNFPTTGITQHDISTKLYASDLPDFVYCQRLFFMKKAMKTPRVETFPMVRGTNEHEIRRTLAKSLICEYESCRTVDSIKNLDYQSAIDGALDYGTELARSIRSEYFLQLEEMRPILRYRLLLEENQRHTKAVKMAQRGIPFERILDELLPWKFETGVGSDKLGITGRVDQVYKISNLLIPVDFKTHFSRISALMLKESHFEQLAVYGILLEEKYPEFSVKNGIIKYTEDLHDEKFNITKKSKLNVLKHIEQAKNLIKEHQLPPKLSGEQAIKCQSCFLRQFCFSLEDGSDA